MIFKKLMGRFSIKQPLEAEMDPPWREAEKKLWAEEWERKRLVQEPFYSIWADKYGKESADKAFGRNEEDPFE